MQFSKVPVTKSSETGDYINHMHKGNFLLQEIPTLLHEGRDFPHSYNHLAFTIGSFFSVVLVAIEST